MENIVMATQSGMPMADGTSSAGNGVDTAEGGLFGMFVDMELSALAGKSKSGQKTKTDGASDALAAMLLSSLFQGGIGTQNSAQGAGQNAAGMQLVEFLAAHGGAGSAMTQLLASDKDASAALLKLLGAGQQDNSPLTGILSDAANQGGNAFPALLAALNGNGGAAQDAAQSGLQALNEIKSLFEELIAKTRAEKQAADAANPAQPGNDAQANGLSASARKLETLLNDIIGRIDESAGSAGAAGAVASTDTAASGGSADSGQAGGAAAETLGKTGPDKPAVAAQKKEPTDFSAALRAYHGETARVSGSTQASDKSAAAGAKGSQAFDSIVDSIKSMQNTQQKEMEISLKPDFLGRVVIKLTMDDGGLVAKIAASNPKVQDAFLSQATTLQNSLAAQGLKDVRIVVTSSSVQDAALQQQSEGRGQGRQEKQKRAPAETQAVESFGSSQPIYAYEQAYRTGTVNRLA